MTGIKVILCLKTNCAVFFVFFGDSGKDFSFPIPSPFLKLNDNDVKSFLNGYPKI